MDARLAHFIASPFGLRKKDAKSHALQFGVGAHECLVVRQAGDDAFLSFVLIGTGETPVPPNLRGEGRGGGGAGWAREPPVDLFPFHPPKAGPRVGHWAG
jgi:hypothetical protein